MALFRWLKTILSQWVAEVTGGALVGGLALYSSLSGKTVPPKAYLAVVGFAFLHAMFLAWRQEEKGADMERAKVAALEADKRRIEPSLVFIIPSIVIRKIEKGQLDVRVDMLILNSGEQTSLHSWQASVRLFSGKGIHLADSPWMFEENEKEFMGKPNLVLDDQVIVRGGKRTGWIRFTLTDDKPLEPVDVRIVSLACYDSFGDFHEINGPDVGPDKPSVE